MRLFPLVLAASMLVSAGCSMMDKNPIYGEDGLLRDRSQDYEKASADRKLEIPAHLKVRQTEDLLVVPTAGQTAAARVGSFEVPRPEFFYADTGSEAVNLKRQGDEKLIVVDEPIAAVWEKTLDFMKFNAIPVASANPRTGEIESDWILVSGPEYSMVDSWIKRLTFQTIEGGTKNKLKFSVKPDAADYGRTSIALQHVALPEDAQVAAVDWDNTSHDVGYKSDMMFEMLRYLSKATLKPSERSLLAYQQQPSQTRPQLGRDSRGNPVLKFGSSADQSWSLLNTAVDRADLDVGTRDQSLGMMYMTYTTSTPIDRKKEMGFFEWLFSDREEIKIDTGTIASVFGVDDDSVIRYSANEVPQEPLEEGQARALDDPNNAANQDGYKIWFAGRVVYVFGGGNKKGSYNAETDAYEHTGRYQLKMTRSRSGVYITVKDDEGLAAPAIVAEEILWAIKDNIPAKR